jgi:hypothetical protein
MKLGYNMIPSDFLMFSGDRWALYKVDTEHFESWVYHCCNPMAARFTVNRFLTWTELLHHTVRCWKCKQECPDDILTVWKIHNFDGIQSAGGRVEMMRALNEYGIAEGLHR